MSKYQKEEIFRNCRLLLSVSRCAYQALLDGTLLCLLYDLKVNVQPEVWNGML